MKTDKIFVFDTNALISAYLIGGSASDLALRRAISLGELAFSEASLQEFTEVLFRSKFDRYFRAEGERLDILKKLTDLSITVSPSERVSVCRDPDDNALLEVAVSAGAVCIVSGDSDLLVLNPFRGIPIVSSSRFLELF